jgi:hypothetical protein
MKLLIMQFPPISCQFISLQSKYSPQHPVLKHPQSVFLLRQFNVLRQSIFCSLLSKIAYYSHSQIF